MKSASVVSLQGIKKSYKLYQSPIARFKEALHPGKKRYYEDFYALKGVDLEVPKGETWGIIGLNGSGKSTLLKIICGVIQPDCGELEINGRIAALLELGSGFNPEYTGRQNVFFAGALADVSRAEMELRFPEIEEFADIGDFIDQPVKSYSSGMLMRLAFAVAVNVKPDILVVDEALAVGDARFQHKCMKKIKSFKGHSTMLLVTHDMNAVLTLCDQVVWLHEGELLAIGEPKSIADRYTRVFYEGEAEDFDTEKFKDSATNFSSSESFLPKIDSALTVSKTVTAYGEEGVKISHVSLLSRERGSIDSVYGGEAVVCSLWLESTASINNPVAGLSVRNKLGIEIFGFNTITLQADFAPLLPGKCCLISFEFVWPQIAPGNYAVSVAVADGDMEQWTMHHFIQDILMIDVLSTKEYQIGLVAVDQAQVKIDFTTSGIK